MAENKGAQAGSVTSEYKDITATLRADRLPECSFDDGQTWELDGVGIAETFTEAADLIDHLRRMLMEAARMIATYAGTDPASVLASLDRRTATQEPVNE